MNVLGDPDYQRGPIAGERWAVHRCPRVLEDRVSFPANPLSNFCDTFFLSGCQRGCFKELKLLTQTKIHFAPLKKDH
jgi:hypothetical protein